MTDAAKITDLLVTDADLAALFSISARYIRKFAEQEKLTRIGNNRFKLGDAVRVLTEDLGAGRGDLGKQLMAERIRKTAADANSAELAYAIAKNEVAPLAEIEKAWRMSFAILQTNILNVPARSVLQLLGCSDETKFKTVLRAELVSALEQSAAADMHENDFDDDIEEQIDAK